MQTVDRITRILTQMASSASGLTLSELADATDLPPATCHRLLAAMHESRLVERGAGKRWHPGVGLVRIASSVAPVTGFGPRVEPVLTRLRDEWQECFYLSVLIDGQVVCVGSVEATDPHRVSVRVPLGRRMSLHASAAAKAILAGVAESEARSLIEADGLERFTRYTLQDLDAVAGELRAARRTGYAVCKQEVETGVVEYAATVAAPPGESPRSVGVVGTRARMGGRRREGLLDSLLAAAAGLSDQMRRPRRAAATV